MRIVVRHVLMSPPNPKLPRSFQFHESSPDRKLPRSFHTAAPPPTRRRREHAHPFSMGPTRPRRRHSPLTDVRPSRPRRRATLPSFTADTPTTARVVPRGRAVLLVRTCLLAQPAPWRLARQKTERKGEHSMSGTWWWCRNEMLADTGAVKGLKRVQRHRGSRESRPARRVAKKQNST